ncbi:SDR family NAD(P)-dependent oxidoreductase [Pinisolibacter aquiterrae]|uniref:SDR family NAD(P)-dependent oxidoreductase n=1 Tax=Pinisolibacter aquiterrae TaxID=2815579 RepID=UPI001C3D6666|nr:SDR family oxidoreductase [Pinisolibacter aquiterrae]MBV5262673.1 glucose 1-dehydrogenase [Pinisolibacter aquiterrae]MCC8236027.1 SDR family oxidoreductase [Pinisolibacter aquiterrae]
MTPLLQGKISIVTGGARRRGIGRATARLFHDHGAKVAILDLETEELERTVAEIGGETLGIPCDLRDRDASAAAVARVVERWGRIDCLVNNAGLTQRRRLLDVTAEDYDLVTDVSLGATLRMSQLVIPHMPHDAGASIVCVASLSALQGGGVFGGPHYCAAKAGVLGLMRAMARELGPDGIRANAVAPGLTLTDFSRGANPDENKHEAAKSFPLRRVGRPEDIANACLFLASDMAAWITGVTLDVNGGQFIHA